MTKVNASEIRAAIRRAEEKHPNWQAELCEILLMPSVLEKWQEVNGKRFSVRAFARHPGLSDAGRTNENTPNWRLVGGYVLERWNSVRENYYAHSPASAWDGIRRETYHSFLEALRHAYYSTLGGGIRWKEGYLEAAFDQYDIHFVNDLI